VLTAADEQMAQWCLLVPAAGAPCALSKQDHLAASLDSEPGPSPAYRLQQSVAAVHHRVVRRLDQHEAWGACPAGAKGAGGVGSKAVSSECDGPRCTGFSLFSPVKKQRVPLFDESGTINVGVSPARPHEPGEDPAWELQQGGGRLGGLVVQDQWSAEGGVRAGYSRQAAACAL